VWELTCNDFERMSNIVWKSAMNGGGKTIEYHELLTLERGCGVHELHELQAISSGGFGHYPAQGEKIRRGRRVHTLYV
jgi:hypothetical protein